MSTVSSAPVSSRTAITENATPHGGRGKPSRRLHVHQSTQKETQRVKRDPAFTETLQIAIVVRDLDATIRRYEDDFGIGPWTTHEIKSTDIEDVREHGQPAVEHACAWPSRLSEP